MHLRNHKVVLALVLTVALVLGLAGTAFASWSDLTSSILGDYGITESEVAQISDGYTDGSWKPYADMQRRHFVKMADDAYGIMLVSPDPPTYPDVPASDYYYPFIEGATAAELINGFADGTFRPYNTITREQGIAIITRYVADVNGYDLESYYTDPSAEYAGFLDAGDVSDSLVEEMAFAVDFGIVKGNDFNKLDPQGTMSRIQGAAMLIRSLDIVPQQAEEEPVVPADVEQVTTDKAENLIGLTHTFTFKVTQEDGSPAPGVLVDIDTLAESWYVGNVSSEAAMTDENGEVSVNAISTEIGVQRVSATVGGSVATALATKYWVAIDEIYVVDEDAEAQNNVGMAHDWSARVVVFGPGPLSTDRQDFYNAYLPEADAATPKPLDGEPMAMENYADELAAAVDGYVPRSLASIPVQWSVVDVGLDPSTPSVGGIGDADGTESSVWEYTDADGLTGVSVYSEVTGETQVTAVADYEANPYPELMVNRDIYLDADAYDNAHMDWETQDASALKHWIPHTFGVGDSPIDPSYQYANLNEQFTLTITLEDVYGNPVANDKQVEWFMQGVGWFVTDDENTVTDGSDSVDVDTTDANGQARVFVKSDTPGEQIVHAKVRDKGIGGAEGQFTTYTAEVQWFDVDVVTFDDPATADNEALSSNDVGTTHDFALNVYGLKLEYDPLSGQTPIIDTDALGNSYDGVFDSKDADYFGGVLLVNFDPEIVDPTVSAAGTVDGTDVTVNSDGVVTESATGDYIGGYTEFDVDNDGLKEPFTGTTGIYLPLEGKDVTFARSNGTVDMSNLGADFTGSDTTAVGTFSPETAVTDENGQAVVTVASEVKGPETIEASVTWDEEVGAPELAYAKKLWGAQDEAAPSISVEIDGAAVANNSDGQVGPWPHNSALDANGLGNAHIEVHVTDQYGNDLPDYEVVYLLESLGDTSNDGSTYFPGAYFTDLSTNVIGSVMYDTNGLLPDHNEPVDADDPYAADVIDTTSPGLDAFYFNQVVGTNWGAVDHTVNPDGNNPQDADGAKAWTMDGYFRPWDGEVLGPVTPNVLTGSNVDVQLYEDPAGWPATTQYKSVINVLVYAPQDGLATDTEPLWRFEVQKVWETPVVDSITLSPDSAVNFTDDSSVNADHTVTATLYDQFGELYAQDATVTFTWQQVEDATVSFTADVTTNTGEASYTPLDASVAAGAWDITAVVDGVTGVTSNIATKYWASNIDASINATAGQNDVTVSAGLGAAYGGQDFDVVVNGVVRGSATYNNAFGNTVSTSWTFTDGDEVFIHFPFSTRDDGLFDWFCDTTP